MNKTVKTRNNSVFVNIAKLKELMNGQSLREYAESIENIKVSHKIIHNMLNGKAVGQQFVNAIKDKHKLDDIKLLLDDSKNEGEINVFTNLQRVDLITKILNHTNYRFFRNSHPSRISHKFYRCPVNNTTTPLIKGILECLFGDDMLNAMLQSTNRGIDLEVKFLENISKGNEFISKLNENGIHIFYGDFRRRFINQVNGTVTHWAPSGTEYPEKKYENSDLLVPVTEFHEILLFAKPKKAEDDFSYITIHPNFGYTFEELKKDYIKVFKHQKKNNPNLEDFVMDIENWFNYQENKIHWKALMQFDDDEEFSYEKYLHPNYSIVYNEEALNKFKYHYKNIQSDFLLNAKGEKINKKQKSLKKKEDEHEVTSS